MTISKSRVKKILSAFVSAVLLIGCGASLVPAPGVNTLAGSETAAVVEAAGVRLIVRPNRWSGKPADLEEIATPLRVTIENGSNQPLRILYEQFALVGSEGFIAGALAPFKIEGVIIKPVFLPRTYYTPDGFTLASYYRIYNQDEDTFEPRHPWDYDEYTPTYNLLEFPLPSEDMLEKGMPEGVLEPGSDISGFLYFSKHEWSRVTFTMNLVDANTGKPFGTIRIPFVDG